MARQDRRSGATGASGPTGEPQRRTARKPTGPGPGPGPRPKPGPAALRRPTNEELDALWARLLGGVGFPARCPRAACRRSGACRPRRGHFACRAAFPEEMAQLQAALSRGLLSPVGPEEEVART